MKVVNVFKDLRINIQQTNLKISFQDLFIKPEDLRLENTSRMTLLMLLLGLLISN